MANVVTPNMGLTEPAIGNEPSPVYGTDQNNNFNILDSHDHSSGKGVPVTPAGLNINADLPFNDNNATGLKTVRFQPLTSAPSTGSDIGCVYELNGDLWYNDSAGDQIQLTSGNQVVAAGVFTAPLLMGQVATPGNPASGKDKLYFKAGDNLFFLTSAGSENQIASENSPFLMDQSATPANPAANKDKLYFKSDDNVYQINSAGTEKRITPVNAVPVAPTVSTVTASSHTGAFSANGSGTYTTPAGVLYIRVIAIGGGGGGGASGTASLGTAGPGLNTTFGTALISAGGGGAGTNTANAGATGGATSLGSSLGIGIGGQGTTGGDNASGVNLNGTAGGGAGGGPGGLESNGIAAISLSGGGGGGAGTNTTSGVAGSGSGGGGGGFTDSIILSPTATYAYVVGTGGAGATAGTNGFAGGLGAGGQIVVWEYYQ